MKLTVSFLLTLALATSAAAEGFAPVALNSLTVVPAKIATAPVMDQNGAVIGKVRAVATDQDGRLSAISYVSGNRLLVIGAPAVSYDAQKNIVVADTSKAQLGAQVASN